MASKKAAATPWVKLAILKPAAIFYQVKKGQISIGRSKSCDVIFPDSRISSIHCNISQGVEQDDGSHDIVIEDTSSNGTKIQRSGEPVKDLMGEKETLRFGDKVYLLLNEKNPDDCICFRIDRCDNQAGLSPHIDTETAGAKRTKRSKAGTENLKFGRYRLLKNLGSGSFAQVKLAFDVEEDALVALKFIDRNHFFKVIHTERPEARTAEVDLLKQIRHENIVAFLGEHDDEEFIVLALEYVSGGELFDYILDNGRLEEPLAKSVFRQLVSAVTYLHTKGIAHRDLKPENILLHTKRDGSLQIKVTDFGLSRLIPENSFMQSIAGSPGYHAPEVTSEIYTKKVDIWSLGVILYILLSGCPPYNPQMSHHDFSRLRIRFPMPQFAGVSQKAKDLILTCLELNPSKRPSAYQLSQNAWVSGRNVRRLAAETGSMEAPPVPMTSHKKRKFAKEM